MRSLGFALLYGHSRSLQMVQIFKDIRTKAAAVLEEMSAALVKLAEEGATMESRKAFVESCKPVWGASGVCT